MLVTLLVLCVFCCPQTHVENSGNLLAEKSSGDDRELASLPAAEVESVRKQPSLHLIDCDDEALASAENENNMNVESENSNSADRSVEAAATADVLTTAENSENVVDFQLGETQDSAAYVNIADDEVHLTERCSVGELSTEANPDVCETKSTTDHAVLSSCSAMIIEVQDHEFSDEEVEETGKSGNDGGETAVQAPSDMPGVEQHQLQLAVDSKPVAVEQDQKNQPATRVIRLNRNFSQPLTQTFDTPDYPAIIQGESGHKLLQKPAYVSKRPCNDSSSERAKLTIVPRSNDAASVKPKQLKADQGCKASQPVQKNVAGVRRSQTRSGEVSSVKVKSKLSRDSVPVTSSKYVADEDRETETSQQVLEDQQSDVSPETIHTRYQRDGSSESECLSKTQLEILELEMRARAIKAMIRAQEEMEQLESVEKKRRSSGVTDLSELTPKQLPQPPRRLPQTSSSVRQPSSTRRGDLRSLQSVVGRNIMKRAEFVARHQRRVAAQERFQQPRQFVDQRRIPQAALMTTRRMVRLESDTRLRPMRYVVTSESSPRIIRLPGSRIGVPFSLSRRQQQRRFELHRNLASSDTSRADDKRRVLVSSTQRSVRLSSSSTRPSQYH